MATKTLAGREYNVVTHYRRRNGKLVFAGTQLERLDKKDRSVSGRQRRIARKLAKREGK